MIDLVSSGFLVLLLTVLLASWILPLVRRDIGEDPRFRGVSASVYLITGFFLLGLTATHPTPDIFLVLKVTSGCVLLYDGAGMIMRLYTEKRSSCYREQDMG